MIFEIIVGYQCRVIFVEEPFISGIDTDFAELTGEADSNEQYKEQSKVFMIKNKGSETFKSGFALFVQIVHVLTLNR